MIVSTLDPRLTNHFPLSGTNDVTWCARHGDVEDQSSRLDSTFYPLTCPSFLNSGTTYADFATSAPRNICIMMVELARKIQVTHVLDFVQPEF